MISCPAWGSEQQSCRWLSLAHTTLDVCVCVCKAGGFTSAGNRGGDLHRWVCECQVHVHTTMVWRPATQPDSSVGRLVAAGEGRRLKSVLSHGGLRVSSVKSLFRHVGRSYSSFDFRGCRSSFSVQLPFSAEQDHTLSDSHEGSQLQVCVPGTHSKQCQAEHKAG